MNALPDASALPGGLLIPAQILLINLLLSADNALVIALACRGMPASDAARARLLGIVGAIVLRLTMGSVAVLLLRAPFLQLAAGVLLLWIAVRLTLIDGAEDAAGQGPVPDHEGRAGAIGARLAGTVWTIIVADVAMSLDNVVAVAAIAQGSVAYIAVGLTLGIPVLIWGSHLLGELLDGSGLLVLASGAFLGWVAGGVAVSDPMIAPSIAVEAPALPYAVPLAFAIFVVWQHLILDPRRGRTREPHAG